MKQFKYFPQTPEDIKKMLKTIGIKNVDELFSDIPGEIKNPKIDLSKSLSEIELRDKINNISKKNKELVCFKGCGSYDVYVPSIIDALTSRQEFLTSYTPYQAEISQGTLQYIFEFQSIICELTGLDCANASMYDGATSTAEAVMMACNYTRRNKVLVSKTLNPFYLEVVRTYAKYKGYEIIGINEKDFVYDYEDFLGKLNNEIACCVFQYPNYYGNIEKYDFIDKLKEKKIQFVLNCDLSSLGLLKSPGELGCDIACGDGQTLGINKSFGGPYVGYMACKEALVRKLPGRIVGMTKDSEGNRGYVLTLQAREQHIRREKATSNICSNESLMALIVTIYASLLGKKGLYQTQEISYSNSHYLKELLLKTKMFNEVSKHEFLKEFVLQANFDGSGLNQYLEKKGFLGGELIENNCFIFCATETRTDKEIEKFVKAVEGYKNEL